MFGRGVSLSHVGKHRTGFRGPHKPQPTPQNKKFPPTSAHPRLHPSPLGFSIACGLMAPSWAAPLSRALLLSALLGWPSTPRRSGQSGARSA